MLLTNAKNQKGSKLFKNNAFSNKGLYRNNISIRELKMLQCHEILKETLLKLSTMAIK